MFGLLSYLYAHSQSPNHRYPRGSPEAIKANSPLANGYFACIFALQGDLDYNSKTLLLPRSTSHNACSLCKATIHGALSWKNCQLQAPGIASQWTPEAWRQWPGKSACKIFDLSYLTACNVALDYMHTKYLGSDRYQIGSLFYYLVFDVLSLTPKPTLQFCGNGSNNVIKEKTLGLDMELLQSSQCLREKTIFLKCVAKLVR